MKLTLLRGILIFVDIISFLIFPKTISQASDQDLPSYDYRDHGYDFPVNEQGNCNAGYAFAAMDAVQAAIWKKDSVHQYFSVNHAKECNWHALNHYAGLPLNTCEGGNFKMLTNLFTQQGLVLETCDPYVDYDDTCSTICDTEDDQYCEPKCTPTIYVTDWQQFSPSYELASKELIKQKLVEHGPLYSQMDPKITGFEDYSGGYVLTGTSTDPNDWTHGVLIVGWDDTLGSSGAWIVKNSYGIDWGNEGYFYIGYGIAGIGSSLATVTDWKEVSPEIKLHNFDEAGFTTKMTSDDGNWLQDSIMAIFTLGEYEFLQAIEIWTNDAALINVLIYENFNGIEPQNLLFQKNDVLIANAGYHQIQINRDLGLEGENEIAIVLDIQNDSQFFPIAVDHLGEIAVGKTWILNKLGQWQSLSNFQNNSYDAGMRLRTLLFPEGLNHKVFLPIVSTK